MLTSSSDAVLDKKRLSLFTNNTCINEKDVAIEGKKVKSKQSVNENIDYLCFQLFTKWCPFLFTDCFPYPKIKDLKVIEQL